MCVFSKLLIINLVFFLIAAKLWGVVNVIVNISRPWRP